MTFCKEFESTSGDLVFKNPSAMLYPPELLSQLRLYTETSPPPLRRLMARLVPLKLKREFFKVTHLLLISLWLFWTMFFWRSSSIRVTLCWSRWRLIYLGKMSISHTCNSWCFWLINNIRGKKSSQKNQFFVETSMTGCSNVEPWSWENTEDKNDKSKELWVSWVTPTVGKKKKDCLSDFWIMGCLVGSS